MVKRDAGGKKGKLLCCKRIFDRIKTNLAEILPPKCPKNAFFCKKLQESMGEKFLLREEEFFEPFALSRIASSVGKLTKFLALDKKFGYVLFLI